MATIFRQDGFRVCIYPNDHDPAHVHVIKADGEARIKIGNDEEEPECISLTNMSNKDAIKALELVADHQADLRKKWQEYHGQTNSSQSGVVEQIRQGTSKRRK